MRWWIRNHRWCRTAARVDRWDHTEDESEADQRRGLVEGDSEDWGDGHLELTMDAENVAEEEENDRDQSSDEETLKDIVGFRSLSSLVLYLNNWPKWNQS